VNLRKELRDGNNFINDWAIRSQRAGVVSNTLTAVHRLNGNGCEGIIADRA